MKGYYLRSKLLKGFSLIELMVVIAIVALLTAIAVPSYKGYISQSKVTEILSLASGQMSQWAQAYNAGGSDFPTTTNNIGSYIASSVLVGAGGTSTCPVGSLGVVCITLNTNSTTGAASIDAALSGLVLYFTPAVQGSSSDSSNVNIGWTCNFVNASTSNATTAASLLSSGDCTGV